MICLISMGHFAMSNEGNGYLPTSSWEIDPEMPWKAPKSARTTNLQSAIENGDL